MTELTETKAQTSMIDAESAKLVAEASAEIAVAKRFPRDQVLARNNIKAAFSSDRLAEDGVFVFKRGGTMVTDLSIRAAETIALNWTNIKYGCRELERHADSSVLLAYARDLENNAYNEFVFTVPHIRYTKHGSVALTDPRDIYENNANMGSRRVRKCILAVIPFDVKEDVKACIDIVTAKKHAVDPEQISSLLEAFSKYDVTQTMIVKRLGHNIDAMLSAEVVSLKRIYVSLRDGMSTTQDWFQDAAATTETKKTKDKVKKAALKKVPESYEPLKPIDDPIPGLD